MGRIPPKKSSRATLTQFSFFYRWGQLFPWQWTKIKVHVLNSILHFELNCFKSFILRATVCKYREFAVKTEISKFFIFSQKKPFGETFSKITRIFFFEKTGKKWNAASRHIVAGLKPLNYTIFKALGKKDGSRKQLHLWQVSKASQLQYYLVKILQDNEFFTRLKNAQRFLSSALS